MMNVINKRLNFKETEDQVTRGSLFEQKAKGKITINLKISEVYLII